MESGHTPDKQVPGCWADGDIPWVSLNDTAQLRVVDHIAETAFYTNAAGIENSSAKLLPAGAVLFSRDATIGLCAITAKPMAVSQHFIAWICGPDLVPEYLLFVLRSMTQELSSLTMGSTVKTIGMPDVRTLCVPVPPIAEQAQIVNAVKEKRERLNIGITKLAEQAHRLREYRAALISAAVTGQLDIRKHEKQLEALA
jgi:type I restriction enzyme S subunit